MKPFPFIYLTKNNSFGNPVYIGMAKPGSLASEAVWQIKLITYDPTSPQDTIDIQFAGESNEFNKVWNDRESYLYG